MKKSVSVIAALIIVFSFTTARLASGKHKKEKGTTKGTIVKIEGELVKGKEGIVTVKDKKGNLHMFKFDPTTELIGRLDANTGVRVEVKKKDGATVSIIDKKAFEEGFMPDFLFIIPNLESPKPTKEAKKEEAK